MLFGIYRQCEINEARMANHLRLVGCLVFWIFRQVDHQDSHRTASHGNEEKNTTTNSLSRHLTHTSKRFYRHKWLFSHKVHTFSPTSGSWNGGGNNNNNDAKIAKFTLRTSMSSLMFGSMRTRVLAVWFARALEHPCAHCYFLLCFSRWFAVLQIFV